MIGNDNARSQLAAAQRANLSSTRAIPDNVRATVRYALHTEVEFSWTGIDGVSRDGRGETRDVSQKGAYVVASSYPPKGAAVKIVISLPPALGTGKPLRMEAAARVVRVDPAGGPRDSGGCGFAVWNEQVLLCSR
jgi:PilZ domain